MNPKVELLWNRLHQLVERGGSLAERGRVLAERGWERLVVPLVKPEAPVLVVDDGGGSHLELAIASLRQLLEDPKVPVAVRQGLEPDYAEVRALLSRLESGEIHLAVFGRVGVGKSALLNAVVGEECFTVSPLNGETVQPQSQLWRDVNVGGVHVIDTPGINEIAGVERERLAHEVARRSDLVLFVADGDLTHTEFAALEQIAHQQRPVILVLNKIDRYTTAQRELLLSALRRRVAGLVPAERVIPCAAQPAERIYIELDGVGNEVEVPRQPLPDLQQLRELLWGVLELEGKTLAAMNAALFAGQLAERVARRMVEVKRELAEQLVRTYCVGKGVAAAFNPVPLADMFTLAADAVMIVQLGRVYGLALSVTEAGGLLATIVSQMMLVMGATLGAQALGSAMKGMSMGLSTLFTAGTQGAVAYYSTYVVGQAAQRYFIQGKSWGESGPKRVVREILESLDRESILAQAREEILARIKVR